MIVASVVARLLLWVPELELQLAVLVVGRELAHDTRGGQSWC